MGKEVGTYRNALLGHYRGIFKIIILFTNERLTFIEAREQFLERGKAKFSNVGEHNGNNCIIFKLLST